MPRSTARDEAPEERAYCPVCGRTRVVVDRFEDVTYVPAGQLGVRVTAFECGHSGSYQDGTFYPIP